MLRKYAPLHNFYDGTGNLWNDFNYNSPFTSRNLNLRYDSNIDLELQFSYDASVNIVFTDDINPLRLINSRFIVSEDGQYATIAERRQTKDTNTYSDENFHRTELIPTFRNTASVEFLGLNEGGSLKNGGYRYYFRYLTADGAESDIIEESRLVEVHKGFSVQTAVGDDGSLNSGMSVKFRLDNLDDSFYAIRVYYSYSVGDYEGVSTSFMVDKPYVIENSKCFILHTGGESLTSISNDELNLSYNLISSAKTITTANNRLLPSNVDLSILFDNQLGDAAASVTLTEKAFKVSHPKDIGGDNKNNYSNPKFTYNNLGYWKGETYELGIVYTSDRGVSPVYPTRGLDNILGDAKYEIGLASAGTGFHGEYGENALGVYRTKKSLDSFWAVSGDTVEFNGTHLVADVGRMFGYPVHAGAYELQSDSTAYIIHDNVTGEYTLAGEFNKNHSAGETTYARRIPNSPTDVVFTFTNSDGTDGIVTLKAGGAMVEFTTDATMGTNLDSQTSFRQSLPDDVTGFYFVRRKRKKDVQVQGIITPTFAIPTYTSIYADTTVASTGNWTGIGVKSEVFGQNVTFVPSPACLSPWGVESFEDMQKMYDDLRERMKNYSTDFIQRAPILDYNKLKGWAFYSPDVDTAKVDIASRYTGNLYGISIINENLPYEFKFVDDPPIHSIKLPDRIELIDRFSQGNTTLVRRYNARTTYVESGSFDPSARGFSAKHDRNLALFTNIEINKPSLLDFQAYTAKDVEHNIFGSDGYPVASGVEGEELKSPNEYGPKLDSDTKENRTPSIAVNYGRYIGIRIDDYLSGLEGLNMTPDIDYDQGDYYNQNWQTTLENKYAGKGIQEDGTSYAYYAEIYNNNTGKPLGHLEWRERYDGDEDSPYFAISRRYSVDEITFKNTKIDLYGGDCYVGMQWKQVWNPIGIPGSITTNDLDPYRFDRSALGLLNYGFAIPVPVQANHNFNVRSLERADENEYMAYGRDRNFLPIKDKIRGDRLVETGKFNHGYDSDNTARAYFRLNRNTPFIRLSYPNRVYASDVAGDNDLWNGFTVFKSQNYMDYNSEFGAITKVITTNNTTIVVFNHGIAIIGVNEKTMVTQEGGGVFLNSFDVLNPKSVVVTNKYGSQHLHSIIRSVNYTYGVDALNKKVWMMGTKGLNMISDYRIQDLLAGIIDEMQEYAVVNGGVFDIFGSYDLIKNEVGFTFTVLFDKDKEDLQISRTLLYNESLGVWVGETDDTRKFLFKSGEDRYSFPSLTDFGTFYKYYRGETNLLNYNYNKFYKDIYPATIGFVVLDTPAASKIFENMQVYGNKSIPTKALYEMDSIEDKKTQIFIPSTNVAYEVPGVTVVGIAGRDYFDLSTQSITKWNGEPLGYGDFITVTDSNGNKEYYVTIAVEAGSGTAKLYVDRFIPNNVANGKLTIGYKTPIRLATSILEDNLTKLVIKTKDIGDNHKIFIPRGKWLKVNLTYDGMAPIYIVGVSTIYNISTS